MSLNLALIVYEHDITAQKDHSSDAWWSEVFLLQLVLGNLRIGNHLKLSDNRSSTSTETIHEVIVAIAVVRE